MKLWILSGVIGLHLMSVILGAAKIQVPSLGPLNKIVALYLGFSGSHYSWGFFAPNIGSQFKVDFKIQKENGDVIDEQLGSNGPNEGLLRKTGIAATFWHGMKDQKVRRSLVASWAAGMFTKYPDAKSIRVNVDAFYSPSLESLRQGGQNRWVNVYSALFSMRKDRR